MHTCRCIYIYIYIGWGLPKPCVSEWVNNQRSSNDGRDISMNLYDPAEFKRGPIPSTIKVTEENCFLDTKKTQHLLTTSLGPDHPKLPPGHCGTCPGPRRGAHSSFKIWVLKWRSMIFPSTNGTLEWHFKKPPEKKGASFFFSKKKISLHIFLWLFSKLFSQKF